MASIPTCVLEQQAWGLPQGKPTAEESQREGVSGLGRPQQEVELSTSVTDGHVTSQVSGKRPGLQLRASCRVLEEGLGSTAVVAPGGITKKWVRMVPVT